MGKAVMISIKPKWVELIASGEKTVEVRKTRPILDTPFKTYICCTKPSFVHEDFFVIYAGTEHFRSFYGGGKVLGEFVCDKIYEIEAIEPLPWGGSKGSWSPFNPDDACLRVEEIEDYIDGKTGYGWHISNLQMYDNPKALREFERTCNHESGCFTCEYWKNNTYDCLKKLTSNQQSWCYVEELT